MQPPAAAPPVYPHGAHFMPPSSGYFWPPPRPWGAPPPDAVSAFCAQHRIDASAESMLRSLPPDVGQRIMATVRFGRANENPSAALVAFIKKDRQDQAHVRGGGQRSRGGGNRAGSGYSGHSGRRGSGEQRRRPPPPPPPPALDRGDEGETFGSAWGDDASKVVTASTSAGKEPAAALEDSSRAADTEPRTAANGESDKLYVDGELGKRMDEQSSKEACAESSAAGSQPVAAVKAPAEAGPPGG